MKENVNILYLLWIQPWTTASATGNYKVTGKKTGPYSRGPNCRLVILQFLEKKCMVLGLSKNFHKPLNKKKIRKTKQLNVKICFIILLSNKKFIPQKNILTAKQNFCSEKIPWKIILDFIICFIFGEKRIKRIRAGLKIFQKKIKSIGIT